MRGETGERQVSRRSEEENEVSMRTEDDDISTTELIYSVIVHHSILS